MFLLLDLIGAPGPTFRNVIDPTTGFELNSAFEIDDLADWCKYQKGGFEGACPLDVPAEHVFSSSKIGPTHKASAWGLV